LKLARWIDAVNTRIGVWASWLILVAVLVSAGNAIVRKSLDISSNAWLELQWQLFGAVFMLCAAFTLLRNEHIRVDIVNNQLPGRARSWIELFGHVFFLLPLVLIMIWHGVPFFWESYRIGEMSMNAGGLVQWTAKLLVPLGFFLLLLQALSEIVKRVAILRGLIPEAGDRDHASPVA
jgi:TRAP-type mannitol/chloroaromatic compound transport system permease small subunit